MRRERPDPLVEHVDDHALGVRRQRAGELLHQHERRAQVGLDMRVPGGAGGVVPFVALERAGVVHQHADRAERRRGARQQRARSAASSARSARSSDGAAAERGGSRRRWPRRRRRWCGSARRRRSRPPPAPARWRGRCAAPPPVTSAARGMAGGTDAAKPVSGAPLEPAGACAVMTHVAMPHRRAPPSLAPAIPRRIRWHNLGGGGTPPFAHGRS